MFIDCTRTSICSQLHATHNPPGREFSLESLFVRKSRFTFNIVPFPESSRHAEKELHYDSNLCQFVFKHKRERMAFTQQVV